MVGNIDDGYLRRLDSLARYYNSQTTAHVGYLVSVAAFALGSSLAIWTSVVFWKGNYQEAIGLNDGLVRFMVTLILILTFALWALGRSPLSLKYLLGGVQYNIVLSYITFEHMGLLQHFGSNHVRMLRMRAERSHEGIEGALRSLFEVRLFASKCVEPGMGEKETQRRRRHLTSENMARFNVLENEMELVGRNEYQSPILRMPRWLGFTQRELLFIRCKGQIQDNERCRLLEEVFDP